MSSFAWQVNSSTILDPKSETTRCPDWNATSISLLGFVFRGGGAQPAVDPRGAMESEWGPSLLHITAFHYLTPQHSTLHIDLLTSLSRPGER